MRRALAIFLRQLAEDARTALAEIVRRLVRKVFEIVHSDLRQLSEIRTAPPHLRKNIRAMFPSSSMPLNSVMAAGVALKVANLGSLVRSPEARRFSEGSMSRRWKTR
jgi:hypothetical protein